MALIIFLFCMAAVCAVIAVIIGLKAMETVSEGLTVTNIFVIAIVLVLTIMGIVFACGYVGAQTEVKVFNRMNQTEYTTEEWFYSSGILKASSLPIKDYKADIDLNIKTK